MATLYKKLTGKQKAAILLIALGPEVSAQVFKHLREEEIEQLTLEIANVRKIDAAERESIIEEFYQMCIAQEYISEGGIAYAMMGFELDHFHSTMLSDFFYPVIKGFVIDFSNQAFSVSPSHHLIGDSTERSPLRGELAKPHRITSREFITIELWKPTSPVIKVEFFCYTTLVLILGGI